ncbi:hypothetical protein [Nannocystis sp.]|uniref:hypothetical protein n=1 Tax=Nannocystis sp. TaxID=1962667 RepID=UPI0025EC42A9|nr:hypothetical protein [Nannocystis sp.]MBK7823819.1 hypothetical protein [Nannocystis sp.]
MDDDRPTSSYRTPAADAAAAPPAELLAEFTAPMLGPLRLELGLSATIRLSLDRDELRVSAGGGLRLLSDELPTLSLRHLRLDLATADLQHDAVGLGAFEARAASVALGLAFTHVLDWQPGRSLVDLLLQNTPARRDGRRRVWSRGPASVWLEPTTRLDLSLAREHAELTASDAVYLRLIGLGIGLLAVRYLFATQRLELEGPPGQPLRNALLRLVAWFATRWLRARLPVALAAPGYDPFADPARRAHFSELAARLGAKPAPSTTQPAPSDRSSEPVPSDSTSQPAPSASPSEPAPSTTQPAPSDSPLARLRALAHLHLSPGPLPPDTRLILVIPLGARGSLALCTAADADLELRRRGPRLALDAPGGLFIRAAELPGVEALQIRHLAIAFGPYSLELRTEPALGSFAQAAIQHVARGALASKLPSAALARLAALGSSDELLRIPTFGKPIVTLHTPRNEEIVLRHGEDALRLEIPAGLQLAFPGLDFLPDAEIRGLTYTWASGQLELDATPELGSLGNQVVSQLFRHRAVAQIPDLLGFKGPAASTPIDPTIAAARPAVVYAHRVEVLGPLTVQQDPTDHISISLSPAALELRSDAGVALLIPELQLALVLKQLSFQLGAGLSADNDLGGYLSAIITRLLEKSALAPLRQRLPTWGTPTDATRPWQIARIEAGPVGPIQINLPAAGAIVLERDHDGLELRVDPFLEIRPERPDYLPVIGFHRLRWQPGDDTWTAEFDPAVGPLVTEVVQHIVHRLAPPDLLANITRYLALPAPTRGAAPTPPPVPGSVVWFERPVPKLGNLRVTADPRRVVDLELTRKAVDITVGHGLVAHIPGFDVHLDGVRVGLRPLSADVQTRPPAGPLFDRILEQSLRGLLKQHADAFWPTGESARIGQDTLLVLGRDTAWGPLRISVPTDGAIALHLDRTSVALHSKAGIFISGARIDWLPDFYLHGLGYTFETGAVTLEISGIEEILYFEKHAVSPITLALLGHLIRVLALPRAPAWTARLGLRQFPLPPVPAGDPTRIGLVRVKLPGEFGEVLVSMPADDLVTLRIDDEEASVISERGLFATLPGLRFELSLRGVRYHLQSGEIQVGGLGQLENALLEAVVARQLRNVPQIASESPGDLKTSLSSLLDQLPVDEHGRRVLFAHKLVSLLLPPKACLIMLLRADALSFTADPPIKIDGPARIDYSFNGVRYSFADASFHLDLDNAGALISGLFTEVLIHQVEKRLDAMFKPLLPAAMREPGYSLANDDKSEQHIAELVAGFSALAKRKPG